MVSVKIRHMVQGWHIRVHVGSVDVVEAGASQVLLMIKYVGRECAQTFPNCCG